MHKLIRHVLLWCAATALVSALPAMAASPAAVVEAVDAPSADLEEMDMLFKGDSFTLGPDESVTLSYFRSCKVEIITGGTVTIGAEESEFAGSEVARDMAQCSGSDIVLSSEQEERADVAGVVFRSVKVDLAKIHATAPVFVFSAPVDNVVITRTDYGFVETHKIPVNGKRLDLASTDIRLAPGGTYRADAGDTGKFFKVQENAPATGPFVGRLIGF